jgi:8-oxo-dGTP diphosphatase
MSPVPEFGTLDANANYVLRSGGYAVVIDARGDVAVVSTPCGMMLLGGGQHYGESAELAAVREAKEECGLELRLVQSIGIADELVFAEVEQTYFRKRCEFFLAEAIAEHGGGERDHLLCWVPARQAMGQLLHESQRWAVREACRLYEAQSHDINRAGSSELLSGL